jgi:hypothetical protein
MLGTRMRNVIYRTFVFVDTLSFVFACYLDVLPRPNGVRLVRLGPYSAWCCIPCELMCASDHEANNGKDVAAKRPTLDPGE